MDLDFDARAKDPATSNVDFADGQSVGYCELTIIDDTLNEIEETVTLTLVLPATAGASESLGTIITNVVTIATDVNDCEY